MTDGRHLHLDGLLDDVVHGVVQMALLGLLRHDSPTLSAVEDIRLAVDEIVLSGDVGQRPRIAVDVWSTAAEAVVTVDVRVPDLPVPVELLRALVDDAAVSRPDGATRVRLTRSWGRPDDPGPDD